MSDEDALSSIFRGAVITLGGKGVGTAIGFAGTLLITNYLGASIFGGFRYGSTVLSLAAMIGGLGLTSGVTRFVHRDDGDEYFTTAIGIGGMASLLLSLIFYFTAPFIASVAFEASAEPFLRGAAIALPMLVLGNIAIATTRGKDYALPGTFFPDIFRPIVKFAGMAVVILSGMAATAAAVVIPAMAAAIFVGGWASLAYIGFKFTFPPKEVVSSLLRFSLPLVLTKGVWFMMNNADTLFIAYFLDSTAVGIYASAFSVAILLNLVVNSIGSLFMPNVGRLFDSGNHERIREVYIIGTRWMLIISVPIAFGLLSFPNIVLSLFGSEFPAGSGALRILSLGYLSHIVAGLNVDTLQAINKTRVILINQVATFVLNTILNILLIPQFGILGAASATAITFVLSNTLHSYILFHEFGIIPVSAKTISVSAFGLVIGVLLTRPLSVETVPSAVIVSCIFAGLWGAICLGAGLVSPSQVRKLTSLN